MSAGAAVIHSPVRVAVFGGGRWARVMTETLLGLVADDVRVSVHSPSNAGGVAAWAESLDLERRLAVESAWPKTLEPGSAVVVVNAVRDHATAIEHALRLGAPVLVEKPMTLDLSSAERLAGLSRELGARLVPAHVFLFARYVDAFARQVGGMTGVTRVAVTWTDPAGESRYGERKVYESGLSVYADWLPHILSITGVALPGLEPRVVGAESTGEGQMTLDLRLGDVPCTVELARYSDRRRRVFEVERRAGAVRLDFSAEPGTILSPSGTAVADADWLAKGSDRPVAALLRAFLGWAVGGPPDPRLDIRIGLEAMRVIDQVRPQLR